MRPPNSSRPGGAATTSTRTRGTAWPRRSRHSLQTFGIDEPAGCYDDIELTDTVVTWGSNMAEMHPMLWARVVDRRLSHADMRLINLTAFTTPTSAMADVEIMFRPQTDLAIWNYIAREILARDAVDRAFIERHCVFATGPADIGFAMREAERDTRTRQRSVQLTREEAILQRRDPGAADPVTQATSGQAGQHWLISLDDFQRAVEPYTLDAVGDLARGNSDESLNEFKAKLVQLADVYADLARKVVSFWSMGFNQHTPRHVGQRAGLHGAPTDRQVRHAGQQRVFADRTAVGLRHGTRGRDVRESATGRHGGRQSRAQGSRGRGLAPAHRNYQSAAGKRYHTHDARPRGRAAQVAVGAGQQPVPKRRPTPVTGSRPLDGTTPSWLSRTPAPAFRARWPILFCRRQ